MAANSGIGRGRGRGALLFADKNKRPGYSEQEGKRQSSGETMAVFVSSLSVEPEEGEILPVSDACVKYCKTKEDVEHLVGLLYKRCLSEWEFARCAAHLCQKIMEMEQDCLRTVVLTTIQRDFKNKDQLRVNDHPLFLGCLSFLCQVLATMRDATKQPFLPLVTPVFDALDMLLDNKATDKEIECAAYQLVDLCAILYEHGKRDKVIRLLNTVKDKIVENRGSKESRYQLIHSVEKFAVLKAFS